MFLVETLVPASFFGLPEDLVAASGVPSSYREDRRHEYTLVTLNHATSMNGPRTSGPISERVYSVLPPVDTLTADGRKGNWTQKRRIRVGGISRLCNSMNAVSRKTT
jgi:hypothetical protein